MSKKNQLLEKELPSEISENKESIKNQIEENSQVEDITENAENPSSNEVSSNNSDTKFKKIKKPKKEKSEKTNKAIHVFKIVLISIVTIILLAFMIFTIFNIFNTNIVSGIKVQGIDVSRMSKSDAKYQLDSYISGNLPTEIKVKHGDFESTISLEQIEATIDTKTASENAFKVGREGNLFQNNYQILKTLFNNINIPLTVSVNSEQLTKNLEEISAQLPDAVIQSSYYQEDNDLIVTAGKRGFVIDIEPTIEAIKNSISTFSCITTPVELVVKEAEPQAIDVEKIHSEIYKEPINAYYTTNPFTVYPSENGLDFKISVEEAKNMITAEVKDEYVIPLKTLYPSVSTSMIGTEAFPDQLASFSTNYNSRDTDRTTNLRLAANKVNGTVLMPGETFSYNKVVGKRTIAAGYKEAAVYSNGQVVDGIGGGICQISSTIYNAAIYANLDIVTRRNHQFVPSYVSASRDATVVYGSTDFQFKNNRKYPIKIMCSVSGGVARVRIFGLKQADDYDVQISSYITSQTSTATYSEAYKILKKNGKVVKKVLLSKDTYKRH